MNLACVLQIMLLGGLNRGGWSGWTCSTHCNYKCIAKFWLETLEGRDHSKDLGVDGTIILVKILGKYDGKVWTGFVWLRIVTNGWLLSIR